MFLETSKILFCSVVQLVLYISLAFTNFHCSLGKSQSDILLLLLLYEHMLSSCAIVIENIVVFSHFLNEKYMLLATVYEW